MCAFVCVHLYSTVVAVLTVVDPAGAHASKGESQWSLRPRAGGTSGEAGGGLVAGGLCAPGVSRPRPLQSSVCSPRDTHMAQSTGCDHGQLLLPTRQTAWVRLTRHVLMTLPAAFWSLSCVFW